ATHAVGDRAWDRKRSERWGRGGVARGRAPRRGGGHRPAALRRLGTRGDPVGIRRRGLGDGFSTPSTCNEGGSGETSPSYERQKASAVDLGAVIRSAIAGKGHRRSPSGRTRSGSTR